MENLAVKQYGENPKLSMCQAWNRQTAGYLPAENRHEWRYSAMLSYSPDNHVAHTIKTGDKVSAAAVITSPSAALEFFMIEQIKDKYSRIDLDCRCKPKPEPRRNIFIML